MNRQAFSYLLCAATSLFTLLCAACSDESPQGPSPVITWKMSGARFSILTDEVLSLVPDIENADAQTTYLWTMNEEVVSTEDHYEFSQSEEGEYYVQLLVTNRFGEAQDEVKITVKKASEDIIPQAPEETTLRWVFPYYEINIPIGRDIMISPMVLGSEKRIEKHFKAEVTGDHIVTFTLSDGPAELKQDIIVHVCPSAGTYRRTNAKGQLMANKVYEYKPAPSHQVNGYIITGEAFPPGCTEEQACDTVLTHFERRWMTSLGGWGGYMVVGFDHSVPCHETGSDLCIQGNPYDYQSEPGIIWVSQDVNGDGLPNDLWYELAGSEYGSANHTTSYAMTYYRPTQPNTGVAWRGNNQETGYIPYMSYWNPAAYYWQDWQKEETMTFFGSRLKSYITYEKGISSMPPYPWGYADNLGSDYSTEPERRGGYYTIRNARTWDGKPAELEYIDFVKVQTAITGHTPNLGDASTEIYCISAVE